MIKAVLLLLHPGGTWERIAEARRGVGLILLLYVLPLMLLTSAGEFYGLTTWGKQRGEFGRPTVVAADAALRYEAVKCALNFAVLFLAAQLIRAVGRSFHCRHNHLQAFTAVAYALGPYFLTQVLHGTPFMPPLVVWAVGITLTAAVLYQGVPRVIQPDPPHTFGLYFMSVLTLTGLTLLAQFFAGRYLATQLAAVNQIGNLLPAVK